jgi:hypothetical protein
MQPAPSPLHILVDALPAEVLRGLLLAMLENGAQPAAPPAAPPPPAHPAQPAPGGRPGWPKGVPRGPRRAGQNQADAAKAAGDQKRTERLRRNAAARRAKRAAARQGKAGNGHGNGSNGASKPNGGAEVTAAFWRHAQQLRPMGCCLKGILHERRASPRLLSKRYPSAWPGRRRNHAVFRITDRGGIKTLSRAQRRADRVAQFRAGADCFETSLCGAGVHQQRDATAITNLYLREPIARPTCFGCRASFSPARRPAAFLTVIVSRAPKAGTAVAAICTECWTGRTPDQIEQAAPRCCGAISTRGENSSEFSHRFVPHRCRPLTRERRFGRLSSC